MVSILVAAKTGLQGWCFWKLRVWFFWEVKWHKSFL